MVNKDKSGDEVRVDLFKFLQELNDIAKKDPSEANDRARRYLGDSKKQEEITDFQRKTLSDEEAMSVYPNLKISVDKEGKISIIAKKKPINKKAVATVVAVALVIIVAAVVYEVAIREHPITGISMESDVTEFDVCTDYTIVADIEPSNASDKSLIWTVDNKDVIFTPDGNKIRFHIDIDAETGDTFTVKALSEKYSVAAEKTFTVKNDLKINLVADSAIIDLGKTSKVSSGIDEKYSNCEVVWTSDNSNVFVSGDYSSAVVSIGESLLPGNIFNIVGTVKGTSLSSEVSYTVGDGAYYDVYNSSGGKTITSAYGHVELFSSKAGNYTIGNISIASRSTPLVLVLNNVSVKGTSGSAAISCPDACSQKVTLKMIGDSSISGFGNGSDIGTSGISIKNLELNLNGNLTVTGGDGRFATASRPTPDIGSPAIVSDSLSITGSGTLNVIGGQGGKGVAGTSGSAGKTGSDASETIYPTSGTDGGTGGTGGDGATGGVAIECNILSVAPTTTVYAKGGTGGTGGPGGTGGQGGTGGDGYPDSIRNEVNIKNGAIGGTGGTGGTGGAGGNGGEALNVSGIVNGNVNSVRGCIVNG